MALMPSLPISGGPPAGRQRTDPAFWDIVEDRITDDHALAVRTVFGHGFGTLWELDQDRIEQRLEDIFPQEEETMDPRHFIDVWNSFVRHNVM